MFPFLCQSSGGAILSESVEFTFEEIQVLEFEFEEMQLLEFEFTEQEELNE